MGTSKARMTVGVVIPAYNSARVLADAIESVLSQEPPADRLIVVDDGSTDDTPSVLEKYRGHLEYVQQPNRGPSAARNLGWTRLGTDAVVFLDADDTLLPGGLAVRCSLLADGKVVWGYTDGFLEDSSGRRRRFSDSYPPGLPRGGGHLLPDLLCRNFISMSGTILRRDILESMGGFDESMRWMEDWDLWLRLAAGHPARSSPTPTFLQKLTSNTLSSNREAMIRMRYHALIKFHRLFPQEVAAAGWSARRSVADAHNHFGYTLSGEGRRWEARSFLWTSIRLWPLQGRAWWLLLRSVGAATPSPGPPESQNREVDSRRQCSIGNGAV